MSTENSRNKQKHLPCFNFISPQLLLDSVIITSSNPFTALEMTWATFDSCFRISQSTPLCRNSIPYSPDNSPPPGSSPAPGRLLGFLSAVPAAGRDPPGRPGRRASLPGLETVSERARDTVSGRRQGAGVRATAGERVVR